jgi:transposase
LELIELVEERKMSIYEASKMVDINNATAKDIVKKYRREGKVFIRKAELRKLQQEEEESEHPQL